MEFDLSTLLQTDNSLFHVSQKTLMEVSYTFVRNIQIYVINKNNIKVPCDLFQTVKAQYAVLL